MTSQTQTLEFTRSIKATPAQVYHAFTNATGLREWLADTVEADARKDGRMYLWWNVGYYVSGLYGELAPEKNVAFSWRSTDRPNTMQVQVSLEARNGGTQLTLINSGIGADESIDEYKSEWESSLENLQSVLETGIDLRISR